MHSGFVAVVRATAELDVVDRRFTACRIWPAVVELDERTLGAAVAIRGPEGAAAQIAHPHRAPDHGRDLPRTSIPLPRFTWAVDRPELLPCEIGEQRGQGAIEDGRLVARGDRVAQHVRGQPELL